MPVGEPVHRHDRLDDILLAAQVVRGPHRARAPDVADPRRLAGRNAVSAHRQPGMGALPAARDRDLGRHVRVRGTVGVEQDGRRVARQHAPLLDEPVGTQRAKAQVGWLVADRAVDVREAPLEPGSAQPAPRGQPRGHREGASERHGPAGHDGRHTARMTDSSHRRGRFAHLDGPGARRATSERREVAVQSSANSNGAPLTRVRRLWVRRPSTGPTGPVRRRAASPAGSARGRGSPSGTPPRRGAGGRARSSTGRCCAGSP
jgi:hypothetical protein